MITYETIKQNEKIKTYIKKADESVNALGYTEHSFAHVGKVAFTAEYILKTLNATPREIELVKIAAYMHDIGNLVNREAHAQSGALMAFNILNEMGLPADELADIVTAIGNHDEATANPVNKICAALILADKCDVRRSRVRNLDELNFDIHDRVNYSVKEASVSINKEKTVFELRLVIDTAYGSVMDYFEIFLNRMLLCRKAAEKIGLEFSLVINEQPLL